MERCSNPCETDEVEHLGRAACDRLGRVAAHPQAERHVAGDVAVREERVILKDEPDSPATRAMPLQIQAVEQHVPCVRALQPGNDPSSVVFPDLLGPSTVTTSPVLTSSVAPSTTVSPSNRYG